MEIAFFLPFLAVRLKTGWRGFLQDVFIVSEFGILYSLFPFALALWPFLAAIQLGGWFFSYRLGTPFTQWSYLLRPLSFLDSARKLTPFPILFAGVCLISLSFLGFLASPNLPFWLLSLSLSGMMIYFSEPAAHPNPLFELQKTLFSKNKITPAADSLSFRIPAGKKRFDIPASDKPHILFVILESFRAKNVGCLGAEKALSPCFDALAENGILFTSFHSPDTLTAQCAIASFLGIPPAPEWKTTKPYLSLSQPALSHILSKKGYHPALIQGGHLSFGYSHELFQKLGFQTILGKREIEKAIPGAKSTSWGVHDEYLMPFAASWLEKQNEPAFLSLFTISNHHPWSAPGGSKGNSFFETFSYTDQCLGLLIEELRRKKLLEKSILFIYGDHGQELEDRSGQFEINRHLYQDNIHVPLLIYAEGRIRKKLRIDEPASQIDLFPTVADLLGVSHPCLGSSLLRKTSLPVYFSHPFDIPIQGCREANWKFTCQEGKQELYDLAADPEEKNNLALSHPDTARKLEQKTASFFSSLQTFYETNPPSPSPPPIGLDLSDSLEATDERVTAKAKENPGLLRASLARCLLLTDSGIDALLKSCPAIEELNLQGLDEITGSNWPEAPSLSFLNALQCPRLRIDWLLKLPALHQLHLGSESLTDEDLIALSKICQSLWFLQLSEMPQITDRGLSPLLAANPDLRVLSIEDCPEIGDASLAALHSRVLRNLAIKGSAKLTDAGVAALASLPLQKTIFLNCPLLSRNSL